MKAFNNLITYVLCADFFLAVCRSFIKFRVMLEGKFVKAKVRSEYSPIIKHIIQNLKCNISSKRRRKFPCDANLTELTIPESVHSELQWI